LELGKKSKCQKNTEVQKRWNYRHNVSESMDKQMGPSGEKEGEKQDSCNRYSLAWQQRK